MHELATDPKLSTLWDEQAAAAAAMPKRAQPIAPPKLIRLRRSDYEAAAARAAEDQVAAHEAATRVERVRPGWDVRALKTTFRASVKWYEKSRGFVGAHVFLRVLSQTRAARLRHCAGCSFTYVRNGLVHCRKRDEKCGCRPWVFSSIWWLTKLWSFACELGYFGKGNEVDIPACGGGCNHKGV